jgi:ectoine hydroxylase-related dioxygenase (phytanoyl-CoA dioxygenase family)
MALMREEMRRLDEDGFLVLQDFIDPALREKLHRRIEELFLVEGDGAGAEFKLEPGCRRLANLVNKGEVFRQAIVMPRVLEYVRHVLGPEIKLSSLNARSVDPHSTQHQPLHADMGAVADERGYWVCNTVWILDDFTADNGALRAVPGSHRWGKLPQDALADPLAPHPQQVLLTGKAGTLIVMNAHLWHAGTANRTSRPRTAMHAFYCRRDKPQQQYQKQLLDPQLQQTLPPPLRELLALDDPLNDQLSSQVTTRSGFLK